MCCMHKKQGGRQALLAHLFGAVPKLGLLKIGPCKTCRSHYTCRHSSVVKAHFFQVDVVCFQVSSSSDQVGRLFANSAQLTVVVSQLPVLRYHIL